jgi:hypothetical protein
MLSIILSACLIANPSHCRDFKIPLDAEVGMDSMRCAMAAQPHFAKWNEEHPQWRIKRWKCQTASMNDT